MLFDATPPIMPMRSLMPIKGGTGQLMEPFSGGTPAGVGGIPVVPVLLSLCKQKESKDKHKAIEHADQSDRLSMYLTIYLSWCQNSRIAIPY